MSTDRRRTIRAALVDAGVPIDTADRTAAVLVAQEERTRQLKRSDLATLTPAQIIEAEEAGQLDHLLGRQEA